MALRVLLGDESSSIRKVMQLALQDFGVEVKCVPIGIDVVEVAKSFGPDILFIDVLLQKRSGYDVCADVRNSPDLQSLPVVLMWSGFMDLDEKRLREARPDETLEKPFEASTLREITTRLVPRLKGNPVEQFLRFPHLPHFEEGDPQQQQQQQSSPPLKQQISGQYRQPHTQQAPAQFQQQQQAQVQYPQQQQAPVQYPQQQQQQAQQNPVQSKQGPSIPSEAPDFLRGPQATPSQKQESSDEGGFDNLTANWGASSEKDDYEVPFDEFNLGMGIDNDDDKTMVLGSEKNNDDMAPDGFDFGDDDAFVHVPLTPMKPTAGQNQPQQQQSYQQQQEQHQQRQAPPISNIPEPEEKPFPKFPTYSQDDVDADEVEIDFDQRAPHHRTSEYQNESTGNYSDRGTGSDRGLGIGGTGSGSGTGRSAGRDSGGGAGRDSSSERSSDLSRFKINLPEVDLDDLADDFALEDKGDFGSPELLDREGKQSQSPQLNLDQIAGLVRQEVNKLVPEMLAGQIQELIKEQLEVEQMEQIVRRVAAEAIEAAVWKLVPDIAERMVRNELGKLLKDVDQSLGVKRDPS